MKSKLRTILTSLYLGAIGLAAMMGPAFAGCYVEGSAGGAIANDRLSGGGTIDLSQSGILAGLGGGCRLTGPAAGASGFFLDVFARYDVMRAAGSIGSASIQSDRMWEVMARPGFIWKGETEPYLVLGYAGTNLSLPSGLSSKDPMGWMGGAGIRHLVAARTWLGVEADYYSFDKQDLGSGTSLKPGFMVARATLSFDLYAPLAQRPLK